jgi:dTDP-glucose 4,6-dehydratase
MESQMKKIIVTGGAGFIGSRFVRLCLSKGHAVQIIDKLTYASDVYRLPTGPDSDILEKDICDITSDDIKGADYIVNFAAETHVDNSIKDGKPFIRSNVEGVFNLIEQARKGGVRIHKFIQISTDEVYGDILEGESKETDIIKPSSYYSATKAAADMLVLSAHRTYGLPYIITRTCNNYGPGQHEEKFVPKVKKCLQNNLPIPVYTPGTQKREWIHVDDNCQAIYNIMMSDKVNEIYNIGSKDRCTNLEIISKLDKDNKAIIELVEDRLGHDTRYALDSNKYIKEFGNIVTKSFA